jgi:HK97 family phage major capsid protein
MKRSQLDALLKKRDEANLRKSRFSVGDARGPENVLEIHKGAASGSDRFGLAVKKFQQDADMLLLTSKMTRIPVEKLAMYPAFKSFTEQDSELKKVMTTTSQSNWIPTDFSRDFIDKVQCALKVAAIFPEIVMPRSPMTFNIKNSFSTAYTKTQGSNATASPDLTDLKGTLTAKVIADYMVISDELDQDSAFAQAPMIRNDAINAIARAIENCIINGDTSTTHMDSDVTLSYDQRTAWNGLRRYCLANALKTDLSTFNSNTVCALIGSLGVYGADPTQLAWIVGTKGRVKLINLLDSSNNRIFLEYGSPGAMNVSVVPGGVGTLAGSDVIVSEFCREDINASGFYDTTTKTKGSLLLVRKDGFVKGTVRNILVETFRDIVAQTNELVVSTRMDFQPRYADAETTCWLGYNI